MENNTKEALILINKKLELLEKVKNFKLELGKKPVTLKTIKEILERVKDGK